MNPVYQAMALFAAGIVAGVVGTAGGITSLVSYPALLAVGIPALAANVTNIVAVAACWPGAGLASRPELAGTRSWLRRWAPLAAAGGAAGSVLLLSTPAGTFTRVVPFLVLAGSLALLIQTRQQAGQPEEPKPGTRFVFPAGLFALMVYTGYFGAGSGVMLLALLLFTVDPELPKANALKNMLLGAGTVVAAAIVAVLGPVDWVAAAPLAAGLFIGSTIGPRVARRLPATVLRWAIALLGVALAVQLWLKPGL